MGHALFSPAEIEGRGPNPRTAELAPVGVLPEYQGRGLGSRLIGEGLEACREAAYGAAVMLGDPGYYSRFGFGRASGWGLGNEYDVDDHFMAAELERGALFGAGGAVRYRAQFREVGA